MGWRGEMMAGMSAACSGGICHILSSDRTNESYSIASAVLGNSKHTAGHTYTDARTNIKPTQPSLSGSPRLHGLHAEQP